jgi:hypothetical protein
VKVDGEELQVTLDELRTGYSRFQDYTRKTQQLAEQRKQIEAEVQAARAERERYAQTFEQLQMMRQMQQEQEPDWENLKNTDPVKYVIERDAWRDRQEKQKQLESEYQRVMYQRQQEQAQEMQRIVAEQQEQLLEVLPEWKDPEIGNRERSRVRDYLKRSSFADEEISGIVDHRVVPLVVKAMKYDDMMTKRQKVQPKKAKTKTVKPGPSHTPSEKKAKSFARQMQRLKQTGDRSVAESIIENLL